MNYDTKTISGKNGETYLLTTPCWDGVSITTMLSDYTALLEEGKALIEKVAREMPLRFDGLVGVFAEHTERMVRFWGPVSHLNNCLQTKELREAHDACAELASKYHADSSRHEGHYRAYVHYRNKSSEYATLTPAKKKIIDDTIRDFESAGVALPKGKKAKLKRIASRLTTLSNTFESNTKDAVAHWSIHILDGEVLRGVPRTCMDAMERQAKERGVSGFILTLHSPILLPVMTFAENRTLRQTLYIANVTRSSEVGPQAKLFNNMPVIDELLSLRKEEATLLGKSHYAQVALQDRTAGTAEAIFSFEREMARKVHARGHQEYREIEDYARANLLLDKLEPWDVEFVIEKMKSERFGFSSEDIRPYFQETRVFSGMFDLIRRIYGMQVEELHGMPTWTAGVRFFLVRDSEGTPRGAFYADLYARDHKNQGAWMDTCVYRRVTPEGTQLPVAYLNCNFIKPKDGEDALLTHDDVITNFHEWGHVLHHILGTEELYESSMAGVEWDAIECPSQFNENYCWDVSTLKALSSHVDTKQQLPDELCEKLIASRSFLGALDLLGYIRLGLFDMELHTNFDPTRETPLEAYRRIKSEVDVTPVYPLDRFPARFTHIFSGGYAAGYYTYHWSEVLSANAFEAFASTGDIYNPTVGGRFLSHVLERGASRPFMESYELFLGKKPSVDALLRQRGLLAK